MLNEPGCVSVNQVAVPDPGPGEVLLRVEAATTCGTDLKAYLRGHPQIPMPGLFGHEYSGVVEAIGEGAPFEVGDAVMGVHSAPCFECRHCRRGQENLCETVMSTKVLGSYAEYLLIPARIARVNVFRKPDWLPFERASLLEPLACVAHGVESARLDPEDDVLVIGPGAVGLMFVAVLRHLGFANVTLAGRNAERLAIGADFGARAVPLAELAGVYDTVIECTGKVEVWERSLDFARRGGRLVLFGGCPTGTSASFDTKRLHYDQIDVTSPFHFGTHAVRRARTWLLDPSFDLGALLSGERSLDEAAAVFADLEAGRGVKYVFRP